MLRDVKALADALGERRDPDVQIARLDAFASASAAADRPGIELLSTTTCAPSRRAGNETWPPRSTSRERDLRGRLLALRAPAEAAA